MSLRLCLSILFVILWTAEDKAELGVMMATQNGSSSSLLSTLIAWLRGASLYLTGKLDTEKVSSWLQRNVLGRESEVSPQ